MTGERIEVGQTAVEREEAIRGLTVNDRIEWKSSAAPGQLLTEDALWQNQRDSLCTVSAWVMRTSDGWVGEKWAGDDPSHILLAVIKGAPVFDPQPGDVWGSPDARHLRAFHDPSVDDGRCWLLAEVPTRWAKPDAVAEQVRDNGWVLLVSGGEAVKR